MRRVLPLIVLTLAACTDLSTVPSATLSRVTAPSRALETIERVSIEQGPMDAGNGYTCAFRSDRTVACWGGFPYGQNQITGAGNTLQQLSAGFASTCAIKADGAIACFGSDGSGHLNVVPGTYTQVSSGRYHVCGLRTDNTVACWGGGPNLPAGTYQMVSAGAQRTCGLRMDGSIACAGSGVDIPAPPGNDFVQVSTGLGGHSCALRNDGSVLCWGNDQVGQVSQVPQSGNFVQVGAGEYFACALRDDGQPVCWGSDATNPLGGVATPATGPFVRIAVGGYHACGQRADGTIECWGRATSGELMVPADLRGVSPPPSEPLRLANSCGHQVTGIAFDGLFYYVGEGHNDGTQCITRYTSVGVKVDHKRFSSDMRGLHYVPATGKLVTRGWNQPIVEIDYEAGTTRGLTTSFPSTDPQNQAAADPDGTSIWLFNGGTQQAERRSLATLALQTSFPVLGGNPQTAAIAVSRHLVYMQGGFQAYLYDKTGNALGTVPLSQNTFACNGEGYGWGAAFDGSRIMYSPFCNAALIEALPATPVDVEAPTIVAPASVTVEMVERDATPVVFGEPTASDNVGVVSLFCDRQSGSSFVLGSTTVTCFAVDAAGNTSTAQFEVRVVDTTPPNIWTPGDLVVDATSAAGATVTYNVLSSEVSSLCAPESGSLFPIATTTVTCTATDLQGNVATATFTITVRSATSQVQQFQQSVAGLDLQEGTETSVQAKLTATMDALTAGNTTAACGTLTALINQVNAQIGKKITAEQAAVIVATAERIRSVTGC